MKLHVKIAILIVTIAIFVGIFNVYWTGVNIEGLLQKDLVARAHAISQKVAKQNAAYLKDWKAPLITANLRNLKRYDADVNFIFITDRDNKVLAHTFHGQMPAELQQLQLPDISSVLHPMIITGKALPKSVLHIAFPINHPIGGLIHIGMNIRAAVDEVARLRKQEALFMALAAVLAAFVGMVVVKRVTLPIALLAEQMRRFGEGGNVPETALNWGNKGYEANLLGAAFQKMLKDRKNMEQTLSQQKAEFESMFNSMTDAVTFADLHRKILICNPAMEKLFGYSADELIGKTTEHLYADPADYQKQGQLRYRKGTGVEVRPYEMRYRRKDGSVFLSETSGTQVIDENGQIIGFIALFRDITEDKRRNQELYHFKNTLDATLDCVFMFWPDSLKFFYVNKGATEQVGYTEDELLDMTPLDIKPEYDEPEFRALLKPLVDGSRKAITFETVHQHKDGYPVPVEIFLQYVAYSDETPRYVAIVRDITERKRAEKELNERHQLLMLVINNAPLVLWALDGNGVFTLSLGKGLENLGLKPGQIVGQSAWEIYADNEKIKKDILRALDGESFLSEVSVAGRTFEGFYSPFYGTDNALVGAVGVAVDITERRQAEIELRKHRDSLEDLVAQRTQELAAAVQELEAFSYSVSHDLRSPLRSIDGFSHILMEDYASKLDSTASDYLKKIRNAAQHMAQLIDDLLELSRVTRSELKLGPVNISRLAEAIIQELKSADPERKAIINIQNNLSVQADANLIQIMLQNLLANAWKYTRKKDIAEITLGKLDTPAENVFYVRDNGAGFDMQYAGKLFGAFQRLHHGNEYEGTGIGLATVQRIINRHGGTVWGESEVGKGATFYFQLPTASCD